SASPALTSIDIDPVWLSAIAQIVPEVRERRSDLPALAALDPQRERTRLFEAMGACLRALAKLRPALLILEDLHWASAATIAALEFLTRAVQSQSVLIVGTYREEEAPLGNPLREARRSLWRESLAGHLGLGRLPHASVTQQLDSIPQFSGGTDEIARAVIEESGGNPLFLTEIIRDLLESGTPAQRKDDVPRGLKGTILARIARLSPEAQFLSQVSSVLGAAFDIDTVREVSGWQEREVLDALEELVSRQVVHEAGSRNAFDYAFSHHLVQRTVYDSVEPAGRALWHRRAAHALERMHGSRVDDISAVLARHFDRAGEPERATAYYIRAAQKALDLYANAEALALAERALEITQEKAQRIDLYALCETLHGRQGNRAEQVTALEAMERLTEDTGGDRACDCLHRRIALHRALGQRVEEAACIEDLASRAQSITDLKWRARANHARGTYQTNVGMFAEATLTIGQALQAYSACGDVQGEVECLCALAYLDAYQSKTHESESAFARAHVAAETSGNQALLARTYLMASTAANIVLDYGRCSELAGNALEIYRRIEDREGEADCLARLAVAAGRKFDIAGAREAFEKARDIYVAVGKKQGLGAVALNSGLMEFAVGHVDRAAGACALAEQIFTDLGDTRGMAVCAINLAMAHYHQGDYVRAKSLALRGLSFARTLGSEPLQAAALSNLGAVERELGELTSSCEHLRASIDLRKKSGAVADSALDLAELTLTHVRMQNNAEAQRLANELMALDPGDYAMTWAPQTVPIAAAVAYRSMRKKKRAEGAMDLARRLFLERLANLPDAEGRAAYERMPFNRELCAHAD
ncbi:MAG: hypothetical protein M3R35_08520, partial [Candidatus Eremiobacteraeota bacterium]|nr:hypothetical protein [Candidatus Eremiobacteraeota bacterium]